MKQILNVQNAIKEVCISFSTSTYLLVTQYVKTDIT
jgi:hypothetical protein